MDSDSDETARDKIAGRAVRLSERLTDALPLLFNFLGVPDPAHPPRMGPEARQRRLYEVLRRLPRALGERELLTWALAAFAVVPVIVDPNALSHADRAVKLAEEGQLPFSLALSYCALGSLAEALIELARLLDDDGTCQSELRKAHRLFTEMGAAGHAERLAKELSQTSSG